MASFTAYWGLDGLIFLSILIAGAYVYMTRKFLYWKKRGIAEIPPVPFFGNFTDCITMKKAPGELFKDMYNKMKNLPYFGFYILDEPALMIRDPELVKSILVSDFHNFPDRNLATGPKDPLGGSSLFAAKNPAWKLIRGKLTPIFTSEKLKRMFQLMLDVCTDLETHLHSLISEDEGCTVELKELCARFTTDLIGTTAFGLKVNSLNNSEAEFRKHGRQIFEFTFWRSLEWTSIFFIPKFAIFMGFHFFTKSSTKFLRTAFWETIHEREQSKTIRYDFIDLLIKLKNNKDAVGNNETFEFDGDNLVAQAAIFFTGGFETSSTTLSFAMYELALHQDIQKRLRQEINNAIEDNDGNITYEMMMTLPYLDMVVSEVLRKYPALPFLDRVANADYKVPNTDFVIKKGTRVYIPMLGFHYDPQYFPNPDVFDPERFSVQNIKNRQPFSYMPFGHGPHNCIGIRLGLLQSKLGIATILSKYELYTCKETMIPLVQDSKSFLVRAKGGLYLKMRKL